MEKLTTKDMQELRWWFAETPPESVTGYLAAQRYEPRSGGSYDPYTDTKLVKLVERAKSRTAGEWLRVKAILDRVAADGGRELVEDLRRAFGHPTPANSAIEHPEVALGTPTLLERAIRIGRDIERERLLGITHLAARRARLSPMTIACRVLATDERLTRGGFVLPEEALRVGAEKALRNAQNARDEAFLSRVRSEVDAVVGRAGEAYRAARKAIGATAVAAKEERERAAKAFGDELRDAKAAKQAARFEARLRAAS